MSVTDVEANMKKFYALQNECHYNDLAYVIGVLLGDACIYRSHHNQLHYATGKPTEIYTIELRVKDKEFAETFAKRLDIVLHRPEYRRWHIYQTKNGFWRMVVRSSSFGKWWKTIDQETINYYALKSPSDFLMGLYDSEGNLSMHKNNRWIGAIRIFTIKSTTRDLACEALKQLGLNSYWKIFRPKGKHVALPGGRTIVSSHDLYSIHPSPFRKFFEYIHSSIPRKNPIKEKVS